MTVERRPLLAFGQPVASGRERQPRRRLPHLSKPGAKRQGERLTPQLKALIGAFDAERARLSSNMPEEIDPALVVVFDLAGSVKDFRNAIKRVEGLEFLSEFVGDETDPDDDFYMADSEVGRVDKSVGHSLYLVMSNSKAIDELLRLFKQWQLDPSASFEHGLGKFKTAFEQLTSIRRWSAEDRIRETGLQENWKETLTVVGQSVSSVLVEVELWYRRQTEQRVAAEVHVEKTIVLSGGRVLDRSQITEIEYHALLAELPIQQVETVLENGAESIRLLTADEVMFVSPFTPMTVSSSKIETRSRTSFEILKRIEGKPRVALLDGLPFVNHAALQGRLLVDDPDGLGENYEVSARYHGTAMASLIIHGDLTAAEKPLDRPLYVRPILRPHEFISGHEQVLPNRLFTDLLHSAVKRIVDGDGSRPALAPSVRIINLSIGAQTRALTRRMSPVGRLLDWLAYSYNLLFVVSAGNHTNEFLIPVEATKDTESARIASKKAIFNSALVRGILPPGDALNALTIGATHSDVLEENDVPDTVWDITEPDAPALYGAVGPGVDRSIKPDIHHIGGRAFYNRPVVRSDQTEASIYLADSLATGPGLKVAAPGRSGAINSAVFSYGTSNATALITREASKIFDILEAEDYDSAGAPFPDPQYHPLLVRALLTHASSWGTWEDSFRRDLGLSGQEARRKLTALLGYGRLNVNKLATAATNRAVLIAGGQIARDERHTYEFPLPPSLRAKAEWHRFTITLAFMAPTAGQLTRYRNAKVYFTTPDSDLAGGSRSDAEHRAVRRGSLQHEIVEGSRAMSFMEGDNFPIHVECMDDAQRLPAKQKIRYALVVSAETAEQTSNTIHQEVRERLRARAVIQDRIRS